MRKNSKNKRLNNYIRFTSIAFQMGLTIYLGNLLGEWLDSFYLKENQFYAKVCTLIAVFIAMLSVIIQVSKISKEND